MGKRRIELIIQLQFSYILNENRRNTINQWFKTLWLCVAHMISSAQLLPNYFESFCQKLNTDVYFLYIKSNATKVTTNDIFSYRTGNIFHGKRNRKRKWNCLRLIQIYALFVNSKGCMECIQENTSHWMNTEKRNSK